MQRSAVMVTGCPRSGSTIIGNILAIPPTMGYIEEPLNYQTGLEGTDDFFPYLHEYYENRDKYDSIFSEMLRGEAKYKENMLQPPADSILREVYRKLFINRYHIRYKLDSFNPIVKCFVSKDPTACFSTEYLAKNHDVAVVMTTRHPCGVIASHQRLGWQGALHIIWPKKDLAREYFSPEVKSLKIDKLTPLESLAWFWRATHEVLYEQLKRNPNFALVVHEDFSRDPIGVSRKLFDKLQVPLSKHTTKKIDEMTTAENPTDPVDNAVHWLKRNAGENAQRWKKIIKPADEKVINDITGELHDKFLKLDNRLQTTATPA